MCNLHVRFAHYHALHLLTLNDQLICHQHSALCVACYIYTYKPSDSVANILVLRLNNSGVKIYPYYAHFLFYFGVLPHLNLDPNYLAITQTCCLNPNPNHP